MKRHVLYSVCIAAILCGCNISPSKAAPEEVAAPVVVATPEVASFPFKSDISPSGIVRKKAEVWEYVGAGFYVPLAAMTDSAKAWELARQAQTPKAPSHVQQLVLGGTAYYRALLGPFKTKKVAEKEGKEFTKKRLVDTKIVVEYLAG